MPTLPAALVAAAFALYFISKTSTKVPATVTFAKPTTVIPAGTALLATAAVLLTLFLLAEAGMPPLWIVGIAAAVGFITVGAGSTTTGARVVYDRGGRRMPFGEVVGGFALVVVVFLAIQQ